MAILTTIEIQIFKLIINTKNMKTIFTLALAMLLSNFAFSTVYNVDNNSNRPAGYYELLQVAINNASAGDTIYIYPSNTDYANDYYNRITITKKLHLFGGGYTKSSNFTSKITYLKLDTTTTPSSNPSGSTFMGLTLNSIEFIKPNISNLTFAGNRFTGSVSLNNSANNYLFQNNYFDQNLILNYNTNVLIMNNVFAQNGAIQSSSSPSVVISNNMFFSFQYFVNVSNSTITNNIFICEGAPNSTYMFSNNFMNNLSYWSSTNTYNLPPTGNTGSGNYSNVVPSFVSGTLYSFDASLDYHLTTTATGHNGGTDGTDIGIYGGTTPFIYGGVYSIPKITQMIITNPVINQSTPINVNVKAKKADL